jgi:hypothetical protein
VIRSRVGAGYFVCRRPGIGAPALVAAADPQLLPNTALGLVQGVLGGSRYKVPAGSGFLPEAWLEDTLAPAVLTRALRRQPFASQPAPMQGHPAAREQIALRLEQLQLAFGDANRSALFTLPEQADFKYIVMPMRI